MSSLLSALVVTSLCAVTVRAQFDVNSPVSAPCSCSSGFIPVPVDVTIPVDPSNPEGLNTTNTRRLQSTLEIFAVLCEPVSTGSDLSRAVQVMVHGQSYTTKYWDVEWDGFQNYSYMAHSCRKGISSFAYDNIGAGQTIRPVNATDCQMPTAGNLTSSLARDLKSGKVSRILTGTEKKFEKVVGVGHSQGSATLNYAAINDGPKSPFDGLILTGMVHDPQFIIKSPVITAPASEVNPSRWGSLDSGYITTPNASARSLFYGPNNLSFSPTIFQLDELTKNAGSKWISAEIRFTYAPAMGFKHPVVEMVGSLDETHCLDNGTPCDQAKLQVSEEAFWPDSKNFTMIVIEGVGHDLNLGFGAAQAFTIMTQLFESFVR